MTRDMYVRAIGKAAVAVALLNLVPPAVADLAVVEQKTKEGIRTTYRLTVTPAPEPSPPLRHRLVVREIELVAGNAATHYLRVFPDGGIERRIRRMEEKYGEFHQWSRPAALPLSALPLEEARDATKSFDTAVEHFIGPASLRRRCDWGLGIEEMRGREIIELLLPEFNASRSISRLLALRSRVAVAEGDYDHALDQLRMIYRLAQNVGSEPLLVCGLIGIAQAGIGHDQVVELIGAKDSPNLYWALAELHPMIDIRKAVHFEMSLGFRLFPFLLDVETTEHTQDEWERELTELVKSLAEANQLTGSDEPFGEGSALVKRAGVAGLSTLLYPHAKQRLIDSGLAANQVESMSAGKVVAVDAAREYRRIADEMEKWMLVPYHEARKLRQDSPFNADGAQAVERGLGYMIAKLLLPAVDAASSAHARLDWQTRAIQIVEAVRMHAAQSGNLPGSLDEIKLVPIPLNPATNEAYEYRLDGKMAVLELPFSDGFAGGIAYRFEIILADGN